MTDAYLRCRLLRLPPQVVRSTGLRPSMLLTTAAVHLGASGGALLSARSGALLGLVTSNARCAGRGLPSVEHLTARGGGGVVCGGGEWWRATPRLPAPPRASPTSLLPSLRPFLFAFLPPSHPVLPTTLPYIPSSPPFCRHASGATLPRWNFCLPASSLLPVVRAASLGCSVQRVGALRELDRRRDEDDRVWALLPPQDAAAVASKL